MSAVTGKVLKSAAEKLSIVVNQELFVNPRVKLKGFTPYNWSDDQTEPKATPHIIKLLNVFFKREKLDIRAVDSRTLKLTVNVEDVGIFNGYSDICIVWSRASRSSTFTWTPYILAGIEVKRPEKVKVEKSYNQLLLETVGLVAILGHTVPMVLTDFSTCMKLLVPEDEVHTSYWERFDEDEDNFLGLEDGINALALAAKKQLQLLGKYAPKPLYIPDILEKKRRNDDDDEHDDGDRPPKKKQESANLRASDVSVAAPPIFDTGTSTGGDGQEGLELYDDLEKYEEQRRVEEYLRSIEFVRNLEASVGVRLNLCSL